MCPVVLDVLTVGRFGGADDWCLLTTTAPPDFDDLLLFLSSLDRDFPSLRDEMVGEVESDISPCIIWGGDSESARRGFSLDRPVFGFVGLPGATDLAYVGADIVKSSSSTSS